VATLLAVTGTRLNAQSAGSWASGFNHEYRTTIAPTEVIPTGLSTTTKFGENPVSGTQTSGSNPTLTQFNAVHVTLIPVGPYRGMILAMYGSAGYAKFDPPFDRYSVIDPNATGTTTKFRNGYYNIGFPSTNPGDSPLGVTFCANAVWTKDGILFVAGGNGPNIANEGSETILTFNPRVDAATGVPGTWKSWSDAFTNTTPLQLVRKRWYPSVLHYKDDSLLVFGGWEVNTTGYVWNDYEAFDVAYNSTTQAVTVSAQTNATGGRLFAGPSFTGGSVALGLYPRIHQLSTGAAYFAGSIHEKNVALLTHASGSNSSWSYPLGTSHINSPGPYAPAVLLPNIYSTAFDYVMRNSWGSGGTTAVEIAHAPSTSGWVGSPTWPQLGVSRADCSTLILADASVMVIGGELPSGSPLNVEILDFYKYLGAISSGWVSDTAQTGHRRYHSNAVLLPDARVFVCGGEGRSVDYQIYTPGYLSNPNAYRPSFSATTELGWSYGEDHSVDCPAPPSGSTVARCALVRPGMPTHSGDFEQRYVELPVSVSISGSTMTLGITTPASTSVAPKGYYMLFLISNLGVPSIARWVLLQ
jgi:hypothetical protein